MRGRAGLLKALISIEYWRIAGKPYPSFLRCNEFCEEFALHISTEEKRKITNLLTAPPQTRVSENDLHQEQGKDPKLAVSLII